MDKSDLTARYRGHISLCEFDSVGQQRISDGRVLIIGAGGLASPVLLYLAAAGVGHIGIVDADTVSLSNLQRQVMHTDAMLGQPKVESARRAAAAVNPAVDVTPYQMFLTPENATELFSGYDIVVDCTDSPESRLTVARACAEASMPYVFAAVSRFSGLLFTCLPGTASYTDIFTDATSPDAIPCSLDGILNTLVGVVGSLQATEVLKYLTRTGDLLTNRLFSIDLLTMTFNVLPLA